MIRDGYIFQDKLVSFAYAPGYGHITLTVELNDGETTRQEEIILSKRDTERLKMYIGIVQRSDSGLDDDPEKI